MEPDAQRVATQATVRYAMARDYVSEEQVREVELGVGDNPPVRVAFGKRG